MRGGRFSVHSECCNRIPEIEWLINTEHGFLTVPEMRKSKIKACADAGGLVRGASYFLDGYLFALPLRVERGRELSGDSLIRPVSCS